MNRKIAGAFAAAGLLGMHLAIYRFGLDAFFSVRLPIAVHRLFPIPILFWISICLYCVLASFIYGKPLRGLLRRWIPLGMAMHLVLLLLELKSRLLDEPGLIPSSAYRTYGEVFIFSTLSGLAAVCGANWARRDESTLAFSAYLFYGVAVLVLGNSYYYAAALIASFCIGAVVFHQRPLRERIRTFFQTAAGFIADEKVYATVIFVLSMMIRLFYLSRIIAEPDYLATGSDGTLYDGLARLFLAGEKVTEPLVAGYWLFLALVYKLGGTQYLVIGLVQSVLTSLSCVFMYVAAKNIFSIRVGRTVAFMCAVSFPIVFSSVAIGHQALDIFYSTLSVMLVSLCIRSLDRGKKCGILSVLTGIVFGLSIATREVNFFYPFFVSAWMLLFYRRRRLKDVSTAVVLMLVFLGLGLAPFLLRNLNNIGVLYPVSSTDGADYPFIEHYLRGENPELVEAGIDLSQPGSLVRTAVERPLYVARIFSRTLWNKFQGLYLSQDYGSFDMIFLVRSSAYYYAAWFYVYILTCAGIVAALRRSGLGVHLIILLFIVNRTLVHVFTESQYRHRAPIDPFLIVYFAFGLWTMIVYARGNHAGTHVT